MPRFAPVLVLALLSVGVALAALAPVGTAAPPAQAPAAPELTVMVFGNRLIYHAMPQELVLAELVHPDGTRASGEGIGDASGVANVVFLPFSLEETDLVIRPGDRITITRFNQRPVTVVVPDLTVDVDPDDDRIVGTAPTGGVVQLEVRYGTPATTITRTLTADTNGLFALDLAGQIDLPRGGVDGTASYDDPDGTRFVAVFAAFRASVTIEAARMRGTGTPGTNVDVVLRHEDGVVIDPPEIEITGDGDWTLRLLGADPDSDPFVHAGDTMTITRTGGPLGTDRTVAVVVPDMAVTLDPARERVSGTASAGVPLTVVAWPMTGAVHETATSSAADGTFAVDLSGAVDLGAGWRVRVEAVASPDVSIGRLAVLPQALIGVDTSTVHGVAEPGRPVTITLRAPDGAQRFTGVTRAGDQGEFAVTMGGFMPDAQLAIAGGDRIEVAYVAGDPLMATVPALTARSDDVADTVSGRATAAAKVLAYVRGAEESAVTTTADARGEYVASFAGRLDLARPADGRVVVDPSGSLAFYTTWSAIQLNVQLASTIAVVMANGAPGRTYSARLIAQDGKVVAQASGRIYDLTVSDEATIMIGSGGFFYLVFQDVTGDYVTVQAGDTIAIQAGDDTAELVVPTLEATVFVDSDIVAGRTTPGAWARILVQAAMGPQRAAVATADETGLFTHDFGADGYDIQYNDNVQLLTLVGGHVVIRYIAAPGLTLDLDEGTLNGSLPVDPGTRLSVTVRRGEVTLLSSQTYVGSGGAFYTSLVDDAGAPLGLLEGDEVFVQPVAPAGDAVWMTVPELTVEADPETDRISGRATPGGSLVVLAINTNIRLTGFPLGQAWPDILPSGTWNAETVPTHNVRPGTQVQAQYRVPQGHIALRTKYVALASVEHGGPNVCGLAQPRHAVSATLHDPAGTVLAQAQSVARYDAAFQLVLADQNDHLVSSATGQTVRATLAGTSAEVTLPALALTPDWTGGTLTGQGPADTMYYMSFPALRCLESQASLQATSLFGIDRTDADGKFTTPFLPEIAPGTGVDISFDTPDGHRVFKQVYRALGQVYIDHDRLGGVTNSLADVSLTLAGADGTVRATATAVADADGRFDTRFPTGTVISASDVVTLTAAGDTAGIVVEPLSFDWSPGEPIVGMAPAGRTVTLVLKVALAPTYVREMSADVAVGADGVFRFGPGDVPPRATWTWDLVQALRAVLHTDGGHQIIAQTDDFEGPPPGAGGAIYLPYAQRGLIRPATSAVAVQSADRTADQAAIAPRRDLPPIWSATWLAWRVLEVAGGAR